MNKISDRTTTTLVKIFINSLTVASFTTAPLISNAQTTAASPAPAATAAVPTIINNSGESIEAAKMRNCREYSNDIHAAEEKISTACRKAGMGGGKACVEKAVECDEVTGEESFDTMGSLTKALGGFLGNSALTTALGGMQDTNSSCPQMSGRDYFEEKERIEKDLKEAKKDLAELDKERADAKKEYDDAMKDINEELAKAQEEAKERSHEIDEETQKQIAEFQSAQAQAAKDMRSKKTDILTIQQSVISLDRQKATALIELTDFTARSDCKKKMYDAYTAYKRAVSAADSGKHISRAKEKKLELLNVYNKCMDGFAQKRMAINESFRGQREKLEKQLADANADVAAIEDGLKQSQEALDKMKSSGETKKAEALQKVIALGERSQASMQAAYEQLQTKSSGIAKKETALNEEINQLSNQLMTLGPAPKRGTEYAPAEALSEIEAGMSEIKRISATVKEECPQLKGVDEVVKKYGGDR